MNFLTRVAMGGLAFAITFGAVSILGDRGFSLVPAPDGPPVNYTPPPGAEIVCGKGMRVLEIRPNDASMAQLAAWVCDDPANRNHWRPDE